MLILGLSLLFGICGLSLSASLRLYMRCSCKALFVREEVVRILRLMVGLCFDFTVGQMRSIFD